MLARYINTNPHAIYGVSRYLLARDIARARAYKIRYAIDELRYGVESMIAWQRDDGSVVNASVHRSSGSALLDEAAVAAVRAWHFSPAAEQGRPARQIAVPINFVIDEDG